MKLRDTHRKNQNQVVPLTNFWIKGLENKSSLKKKKQQQKHSSFVHAHNAHELVFMSK